jgi:hypothetical protein
MQGWRRRSQGNRLLADHFFSRDLTVNDLFGRAWTHVPVLNHVRGFLDVDEKFDHTSSLRRRVKEWARPKQEKLTGNWWRRQIGKCPLLLNL